MFFFSKIFKSSYLIIGLVVVIFCCVAFLKYSQNQIEKKQIEIIALKTNVAVLDKEIVNLENDLFEIKEINGNLIKIERANSEQFVNLSIALQKLERTATAKPKLVENIINNAVHSRLRCLEIASGSTVLKNEKNSVCPQFMNR